MEGEKNEETERNCRSGMPWPYAFRKRGRSGDIETLHPSDYSTTIEINILNQVYDKLIYMNPDGAEDPEPRIAESWEISEDGLDYTFHLRDDIKFHDGTPLTAEDVKFSLEMYQNSDYQSANVDGLDTVEVVDDSTVVCHLSSPYSPFLLGISACNIASKAYSESVSAEEFASTPNGCGPYRYVSRASGSNVVLEANEDYYGGAPEIKKVTFEVIPDTTTTAIALQTGEVNFAEIASSNLVMLESNPQITIAEAPTSKRNLSAMCWSVRPSTTRSTVRILSRSVMTARRRSTPISARKAVSDIQMTRCSTAMTRRRQRNCSPRPASRLRMISGRSS